MKRVIAVLDQAAAAVPAVGSPAWTAAPAEWLAMATARVNAWGDIDAAKECATLADLLACPRSAVRAAALLATAPTPPAPKRKR